MVTKLSWNPLEEQCVLLATDPSLQCLTSIRDTWSATKTNPPLDASPPLPHSTKIATVEWKLLKAFLLKTMYSKLKLKTTYLKISTTGFMVGLFCLFCKLITAVPCELWRWRHHRVKLSEVWTHQHASDTKVTLEGTTSPLNCFPHNWSWVRNILPNMESLIFYKHYPMNRFENNRGNFVWSW